MRLSEIMNRESSDAIIHGIDIDTDLLSPPHGLARIGLIYQDEGGQPSDLFVDAVIACTLAGIESIAEVPTEAVVDAKTLLAIAGNAGFSVALLPPKSESGLEAWCARCAAFASAFLDTPHFSGHLYPVSGYFGHLVARSVSGVQTHEPSDPYVRDRFVEAVPIGWSDAAKGAMLKAWEERAGGAAPFEALLKSLAAETIIETMDLIDRITEEDRTLAQPFTGKPTDDSRDQEGASDRSPT